MGLTKEAISVVREERSHLGLGTEKNNFSELCIKQLDQVPQVRSYKKLYILLQVRWVQEFVFPRHEQLDCKSKDHLDLVRCLKLETHFSFFEFYYVMLVISFLMY